MKHILLFVLAFISFAGTINAQQPDSLQNQVLKLMKYYESYDNGSPESLKKANYKDAVHEITGETASQKEIDESYQIIDWYIKGDKAITNDDNNSPSNEESFDEFIENTNEAKAAINYLNQQKGMLQNMSYSEFEDFVEKASPFANKSDIKKAYNEMHKNDGKQVPISNRDKEMTEAQKQMWAIDVLNNPKSYKDFAKACKIMNQKITDKEIQEVWDKRDKY